MKRTAIPIAALAGMLLASGAQAQEPGQSYFGVGFGAVWTDAASPYTNTLDEDTASGGKVYWGSLGDRFGLEVGLYSLGQYDVNFGGAKIAETKTHAIALSGVLATPLGGGYSFHAKVGLAMTQAEIECNGPCVAATPPLADTKKRGVSGLLGLGLGARAGQNFIVRIDYEHFGSVHHQVGTFEYTDGYDMLSVSLQLHF